MTQINLKRTMVASAAALALSCALLSAVTATATNPPPARASGDAVRGERLFLQCRACHTVAQRGANTVGPNLWGIMGARAAARPGYRSSPALTRAAISWTPATMDAWLRRPTTLVPGTTMAFAGVADARNRADLIAYMATLRARR